MRHLFVIVSMALVLNISFAQKRAQIDSLKNELEVISKDSLKLDILANLFQEYLTFDLDSSSIYSNRFLNLAREAQNPSRLYEGHLYISRYYWMKGMADSVKFHSDQCVKYATKLNDQIKMSDTYRRLSMLYDYQGDMQSSIKYAQKSSDIAAQTSDWDLLSRTFLRQGNLQFRARDYPGAITSYQKVDSIITANNTQNDYQGSALANIAMIYNYLNNSKALGYYLRAMDVYKKIEHPEGLHDMKLFISQYYREGNELDKAVKEARDAYKFYQNHGHVLKSAQSSEALAHVYLALGKTDSAKILFENSHKYALQSDQADQIGKSYNGLGKYYSAEKDFKKAIDYFKKAEEKFLEIGEAFTLHEKVEIYENMAFAYFGINDFEKAYYYLDKFTVWKDSLTSVTNNALAAELESQYQSEKKQREIDSLTSRNILAQQEKQNQLYLLLGVVLIVLIAAIFFFILYRNRQKTTNKLQELDAVKSNFFANISHEFRTPLTLIKGPVQEQLAHESLSDSNRAHLQMINRNADRLLSLVDQLLDLSKLESGSLKLNIESASLSSFAKVVVAPFQYLAEQKGIEFITNIPEMGDCSFDKDILEKIVVNLLSNALKYTPEGGKIQYQQKVNGHLAIIEVRNTGVGIPKDQQKKIFDRFYQMGKNQGGVGIGLALVKELVILHKGSINLTSNENEYTCFEVQLPIADTNYATDERASDSQIRETPFLKEEADYLSTAPDIIDGEKPIMLIVEDNSDLRELIWGLFNTYYSILQAENGEEGIQKAIEHVPDVIISDVMMPIKDGVELSQTLKADERTSHIPIILLTAKAGEENELKGLETGADEYMVKPFNNEILKVRVEKLIELRTQLRERYSQEVILQPKDIAISSVDERFLDRVQSIIDSHLTKSDFTAELFSKEIGMSRMQLHRKLKALIGLSTSEFIRSQRLKMAAQLLDTSDVNMSEVAYAVGFNDPSYFAKCFKDAYGCTPSQYAAEVHTNG